MTTKRIKKKVKIRRRLLAAFSAVLFFSFAITGIFFNIALRIFAPIDDHYAVTAQNFFNRAGVTLVVLIIIMFIMAVIVTYFLANSLTRPIEKLGEFALKMGKGDFATNNFEFEEQELEDLNEALNKSVKQLGEYDSTQKTFFQNASHELRTPLMSIKCYAEGINFGIMDAKKASETILQETNKLSELVKDLLYIAKIDNITEPHTKANTNLIELIQNCAARQKVVANQENINFIFGFEEDEINIECIPELMSRAVDNLISNAIRYAAAEIVLACYKSAGCVIITVEDDGPGIESDILPHVFERFYKGKNGNTGIGLSIVQSIINQMNGQIEAENSKTGGAVFTIILPA